MSRMSRDREQTGACQEKARGLERATGRHRSLCPPAQAAPGLTTSRLVTLPLL